MGFRFKVLRTPKRYGRLTPVSLFNEDGSSFGQPVYAAPTPKPIEGANIWGAVPDDWDDLQKIQVPSDPGVRLYCAQAQGGPNDGNDARVSLVAIENAAHWNSWWGDGSMGYPSFYALEAKADPIPDGKYHTLSLLIGPGWYVVPIKSDNCGLQGFMTSPVA